MDPARAAALTGSIPGTAIDHVKGQQLKGVEKKTSDVTVPIMHKSLQLAGGERSFIVRSPSSQAIPSLFSGAMKNNGCHDGVGVGETHTVKLLSAEELQSLLDEKNSLEAEFARSPFKLQVLKEDGSFDFVNNDMAVEDVTVDRERFASFLLKVVENKLDGYDGKVVVHKSNALAQQDSVVISGKNYKVEVGISDKEVDHVFEMVTRYQILTTQVQQQERIRAVAEEKAFPEERELGEKGGFDAPAVKEPRTVPVKVVVNSQPKIFSATKQLFLLLNILKENRIEERRAQQKDEEHQRIETEVVREGIKKRNILEEAVEFNNKNKIRPG